MPAPRPSATPGWPPSPSTNRTTTVRCARPPWPRRPATDAIEVDRCTGDDIRFLITAMVHSATVHERVGAHREALEASAVALEFARFARTQVHDPAHPSHRSPPPSGPPPASDELS